MAVYQELAQGDTLIVGKSRIRLERKSGQRARLMIDSAEDIEVLKAGEAMPGPDTNRPETPGSSPAPFLKRPAPAAT